MHPTGDPYRPKGARRKPRRIRALERAQDLPPPPIGAGGWAGRIHEGCGLGAPRPGREEGVLVAQDCPSSWQGPVDALPTTVSFGAGRLELLFFVVLFLCLLCLHLATAMETAGKCVSKCLYQKKKPKLTAVRYIKPTPPAAQVVYK